MRGSSYLTKNVAELQINLKAYTQHQERIRKIKNGQFYTRDQDPLAHFLKKQQQLEEPPQIILSAASQTILESYRVPPSEQQYRRPSSCIRAVLSNSDLSQIPQPEQCDDDVYSRTMLSKTKSQPMVPGRRYVSVKRREEQHRINLENSRLATAILGKKSEFSRQNMDKEWWQKVMPVKRFMKMSRRPFKLEKVEEQQAVSESRPPSNWTSMMPSQFRAQYASFYNGGAPSQSPKKDFKVKFVHKKYKSPEKVDQLVEKLNSLRREKSFDCSQTQRLRNNNTKFKAQTMDAEKVKMMKQLVNMGNKEHPGIIRRRSLINLQYYGNR